VVEAVMIFSRLKHEKRFGVVLLQTINIIRNLERPTAYLEGSTPSLTASGYLI